MSLSLFSNPKFKIGLILFFLFVLDFFFLPSFFKTSFSFVILGCLFLIFWSKSELSHLPFYLIFIIFYDFLSPYVFGIVSLSFMASLLLINLIRTRFYLDKNLKSSLIFTIITFTIYYFFLNYWVIIF